MAGGIEASNQRMLAYVRMANRKGGTVPRGFVCGGAVWKRQRRKEHLRRVCEPASYVCMYVREATEG